MIFLAPHVIQGDAAARKMTGEVSEKVRKLVPELERDRVGLRQTPPPADTKPDEKPAEKPIEEQGDGGATPPPAVKP